MIKTSVPWQACPFPIALHTLPVFEGQSNSSLPPYFLTQAGRAVSCRFKQQQIVRRVGTYGFSMYISSLCPLSFRLLRLI
jgi:hypothetical protein